jgi:glutathione synthase/RimK-type ligase-like ATP-grasp enzyme
MAPIVVGYLLPDRVIAKLSGCFESDANVRFVRLDLARALAEQPPAVSDELARLDVLVHKLSHEMAAFRLDGLGAQTQSPRVADVRAFLVTHPRVLTLDSLEASARLSNRAALCATLAAAEAAGHPLAQPRFTVVTADADIGVALRDAALRFPVVLKPLAACGAASAHSLCVLASARDIGAACVRAYRDERGSEALLAQELVAHGGVVIKGYVVGAALHVSTRPSLADGLNVSFRFDSQRPLARGGEDGAADVGTVARESDGLLAAVGEEPLRRLASAVSDAFGGLQLFGFDAVLARSEDGAERGERRLLVIDVNALPFSTATFPGLPAALRAACVRAHERELSRLSASRQN